MKSKIFTLLAFCAIISFGTAQAQLIWEENFNQAAGALIPTPLVSSDNSLLNNPLNTSGWKTQSNTSAATNCFDVVTPGLTYNGYASSGVGNALKYTSQAGQSLYKQWAKTIKNDSSVYISFLLNIPNEAITGGDFFFGIRLDSTAANTNWGSCIYAAVAPAFPNEEITFSIKKQGSSLSPASVSTKYFPAATTLLVVLNYHVGILNGTSQTAETGLYDDKMSLYINPPTTGGEPTTPTIYCADATQKDLYRWGATIVMGGAKAVYLRSSATGNAPSYTIDGIRVGLTWQDVMPVQSGLKRTTADNFMYNLDSNKQLNLSTSTVYYNNYSLVSLSGQQLLKGSISGSSNRIDASSLKSGIYILNLNGNLHASAKILVP